MLWEPLLPAALHLHRFPHVALQLVQCDHQLEPDLCAEFLLDLRARCYAILGSRLLRIVQNVGFCGRYFFVQIEIEDVVSDVDWNVLFSSVPTHQSFEMHPHGMANFAVHWNRETTTRSSNLVVLARDLSSTAQHFVLTSESSVLRSAQTVFIGTSQSRVHSPLAVRWNLPSLAPSGPKFN